ncbi:hypothetical protein CTAM01_05607 [Colletotrichum tamarilloi]|uniref:Uncharacterized protein n=1 Tax=Colletotrichum tamarilloi TaxID=1209934 RepID=A0ABQ9REK1_9PEZI|nr:uncharacterized protein CTAM01_05607 [Colletotrichum tamarilloi]KAK1502169.1 hypothetical protein CTAM01_05607 [Colletotrichum tamarilloi]
MQHDSNINFLSPLAYRPDGQPVSPSPSRRTSLASNRDYPLEPEAQQCLPELDDAATEDVASTITGPRVSTDGTTKYNRVAEDDTDGAVSRVDLPNNRLGFFTIVTNCAAVVLPLGLIVFIVIVWRLDGSESTESSRGAWRNAITILATAFPILFASVVGRLTYEAARWKLETGTTLGSLEQFLGSRTVGATLLNLIQLRSFNIVGAALVLIWALSPLGTQSILRMMSSQIASDNRNTTITYFDTNAESQAIQWATWVGFSYSTSMASFRPMSTLYNTLISMPEGLKADAMDVWGNVKIPFLKRLDTDDWLDFLDQDLGVNEYSSLAGIPLNSIEVGHTVFSLESSYISLDCSDVETLKMDLGADDLLKEEVFHDDLSAASLAVDTRYTRNAKLPNGTWHGYDYTRNVSGLDSTWILALDRFVDRIWSMKPADYPTKPVVGPLHGRVEEMHRPLLFKDEQHVDAEPTTLLFQSIFPPQEKHPGCSAKSLCRVSQEYAESRVNCSRTARTDRHNCTVVAQRKSQKKNAPRDISQLSFPAVFDFVSRELPLSIGGSTAYKSEFSLYHLADPGLRQLRSDDYCIIESVTAKDMGIRLSQLLNTYLLISQLSFEIAEWDADKPTSGAKISVEAETSTPVINFEISSLWITLFLVASIVLLAAGIASVVLKHCTYGPEILGYASTVLRDSIFFDVPRDYRGLDGIDLSRKMKSDRLRFGLIQGLKEGQSRTGVGHQESTDRLGKQQSRD